MNQYSNAFRYVTPIISLLMLFAILTLDWIRLSGMGPATLPLSGLQVINALGAFEAAYDLAQLMGPTSGLQEIGINNSLYLILLTTFGAILALCASAYALITQREELLFSRLIFWIGAVSLVGQLFQLISGIAVGYGFWLVAICNLYLMAQGIVLYGITSISGIPTTRDSHPAAPYHPTAPSEQSLPPAAVQIAERVTAGSMQSMPPVGKRFVTAWLVDAHDYNVYHQLFAGASNIGRSTSNDIVLSQPAVSREHACIYEQNGQYLLQNKSQQGIYVNQQFVQGDYHPLANNDVITFGTYQMYFIKQ